MKPIAELIRLDGKAAVVTGGARRIGFGIAYRLAEAGAAVLVADLDEAAASSAAADLSARGWRAEACRVDASDEGEVVAMIGACRSASAASTSSSTTPASSQACQSHK
jgi:NAD(P)-dependent dehydrogenase (short-subunit alcohol dehydrogenase family)